jgi:hypothetical protein
LKINFGADSAAGDERFQGITGVVPKDSATRQGSPGIWNDFHEYQITPFRECPASEEIPDRSTRTSLPIREALGSGMTSMSIR